MLQNICVTNDHRYFPFVIIIMRFIPHSRLITGFVTILIGRMPLVEQLLLISGVQSWGSSCSIFSFMLSVLLALFLSIIVFSVLLQFTDSDYPFGFFQLFLLHANKIFNMCISLNTAIKIMYYRVIACILVIIMISVNFFCNISSYDILAYITNNYIALIYYAKIVHLLCQFHAGNVAFSAVSQAMYSWSMCKGADPICQSIIVVYYSCYCF